MPDDTNEMNITLALILQRLDVIDSNQKQIKDQMNEREKRDQGLTTRVTILEEKQKGLDKWKNALVSALAVVIVSGIVYVISQLAP